MKCICGKFMALVVAVAVTSMLLPAMATAQIFFTEGFDYADGDLDVVSKGLWQTHSGTDGPVQVVGGEAVVNSPGANDHNRLTGSVSAAGDIWYYALSFNIELGTGALINNDYFIHFKDGGTFNFNARLALDDPADPQNDYSLSIYASSEVDGQADWNGDFSFGQQLVCVVRWNNGTGEATLWVNPVSEASTSITDVELEDAMRAVESIALRQDGGSSSVANIDILSVGTSFDAVLEAVSGGKMGIPGDVNCDGVVNLLDVSPFVTAITNAVYDVKADVNGDGVDSLLDVAPFVTLVTGG